MTEGASEADTETDYSDSTESVGSEANMHMEEADHNRAPAGMQNVLVNMVRAVTLLLQVDHLVRCDHRD